jgi:hypothetical protein
MAEISFAKKFISGQGQETDEARPWRNGFGSDNAGGPNSFCLSLRSKDGRKSEGPSMSLFLWHYWIDDGGPTEKLVLLFNIGGAFSVCGIYVEGLHMKRAVRALLEEGKLKYIQQHDSAEIEAIRGHNLDTRKLEEKEPIVLRIVIKPDLETRLRSDEHLAVIADAMKGESGEIGNTGQSGR